MLEAILAAINIRLSALGHFSKIFYLAEMVHKKTKTVDQVFPAVYNEKGNHSPVLEIDKANGLLYHRKNGNVVSTELEERINRACDIQVERRYPMRLVAIVPRSILKTDNAFIDDKIAENICNSLQQKDNAALNTALKTFRIKTRIQNQSTDRYEILSRETKGFDAPIDFKYAVIAIDYEILIEASASCFEKWDCNDTRSDVLIDLRKVSCENINDPVYGITDVRLAQCGRACDTLCEQISDATAAAIVTCIEAAGAEKLADVQALICESPDMTADFEADNLAPKALDDTTNFTDLSDNLPTNWGWSFGDGELSSSQNPAHIFQSPGLKTVTLIAVKQAAGDVETKVDYINVGYPAEVQSLFDRFTTSPSTAIKTLIFNFFKSVRESEEITALSQRFDALYCLAFPTQQAAQRNWVQDLYNITEVNAPSWAITGYTGNAVNSYLRTGFNPGDGGVYKFLRNDACVSIYSRINIDAGYNDMGARINGVGGTSLASRVGGNIANRLNNDGAGTITNPSSLGLHLLNRRAANGYDVYKAGAQLGVIQQTSSAVVNLEMYLLGLNLSGVLNAPSGREIAFSSIGGALKRPAEFSTHVQTLMTGLGAQV